MSSTQNTMRPNPVGAARALSLGRGVTALLLILITAYAVGIRAYNLAEPWGRHMLGIDGAWNSIIARNFLRYGFFATRGAPILNTGMAAPSEWTVYLDHPPLVDWLVALSFRCFGIHEWSARLVALVFSLGCLWLLFRLTRRLYSVPVAVAAAFFFAAIPMSAVYTMHVDFQGSVVMFFALATVLRYQDFLERRRKADACAVAACLTLCALADWPGFYLAPLLWAHQSSMPAPGRPRGMGWVFLYALALLALFLAYIGAVKGNLDFLFHQFAGRTLRFQDDSGKPFSLLAWLQATAVYWWRLYTLPIVLAGFAWALDYARRRRQQKTTSADGIVWLLIGFGLAHIVVPIEGSYQHDTFHLYLVPAFSICAAATAVRLAGTLHRARMPRWMAPITVGGAAVVLAAWFGSISVTYDETRRLQADQAYGYSPSDLGLLIRNHTQPTEGAILVGESGCTPAIWYYADRPLVRFVATIQALQQAMATPRFWGPEGFHVTSHDRVAIFVVSRRFVPHYQAVVSFLGAHFPHVDEGPFVVFDMRPHPPTARKPTG